MNVDFIHEAAMCASEQVNVRLCIYVCVTLRRGKKSTHSLKGTHTYNNKNNKRRNKRQNNSHILLLFFLVSFYVIACWSTNIDKKSMRQFFLLLSARRLLGTVAKLKVLLLLCIQFRFRVRLFAFFFLSLLLNFLIYVLFVSVELNLFSEPLRIESFTCFVKATTNTKCMLYE